VPVKNVWSELYLCKASNPRGKGGGGGWMYSGAFVMKGFFLIWKKLRAESIQLHP
jgi:hypothetical protein